MFKHSIILNSEIYNFLWTYFIWLLWRADAIVINYCRCFIVIVANADEQCEEALQA